MTNDNDLTEKQEAVIGELPGTSRDIADELGCSTSAVRHRVERINASYPEESPIYRDEDGLYVWDGERDLHRMRSHHQGTITKKANNFLTDDEAGIKSILNNAEPVTAKQHPDPDNEDFVVVISDTHFGDRVEDHKGRVTYDMDIAEKRVHEIIERVLKIKEQREKFQDFDTCHLVLAGDIITGSGVYAGQWEDLDQVGATLKHQINRASEVLMTAIKTLAEAFEVLNIPAVPGNHGELRASGSSKQANADINVYSRLEFAVSHTDYDNIHFQFNDSTSYTNFKARDGEQKIHVRHGESCQEHAGATSASKRDWRGWLDIHGFSAAIRGHYHVAKVERVLGRPIFANGATKPSSDFEESISEWSGPASVVFGCSDEKIPTWTEFIEF